MPDIAFDHWARALVVLHAAAAIVLIGATTHHALIARGYVDSRAPKLRLGKIYAATMAASYLVALVVGLLAYPAYRYRVRGVYFDRYEPWASNLFDVKENFAALGIPLVIALWVMSRSIDPQRDRELVGGYLALSLAIAAIVWFDVLAGLAVTLARGV